MGNTRGGRLLKGRTPSLSARARLLPVRCQLSVQAVDVFAFIKKKKTISVRFCGAYVSPEMDRCREEWKPSPFLEIPSEPLHISQKCFVFPMASPFLSGRF